MRSRFPAAPFEIRGNHFDMASVGKDPDYGQLIFHDNARLIRRDNPTLSTNDMTVGFNLGSKGQTLSFLNFGAQ